jgi:hypothetical protein
MVFLACRSGDEQFWGPFLANKVSAFFNAKGAKKELIQEKQNGNQKNANVVRRNTFLNHDCEVRVCSERKAGQGV